MPTLNRNTADNRGFTLIELLIVVAIIGIIAAIAIPNLLNAIQRGKQKRTMGDMRTIATAVESYAIDFNEYPPGDIDAIATNLVPDYVQRLPSSDGWNTDFTYATDGQIYTLTSLGKDKAAGGGAADADGETQCLEADLGLVSGVFTQKPGKKQATCE